DHAEDQYKVWAIVRHVRAATSADKQNHFEIGVAFIGKHPPKSYELEPAKRYELSTPDNRSMPGAEDVVRPVPSSDQRLHTRHNIAIDMLIEAHNQEGEYAQTEQSVTENISRGGATLFTTMEIPVGRFVRLTSQQYNLTVHAAVRARSTGADGIRRIHVEFIDKEWPL
ncbi:MAG TPA: PilZ domain-containing protein, partial [Pyrinomonadaceae bacterium]